MQDYIGMAAARFLGKRVTEMAKIMKAGMEIAPAEELGWPKGPVPWETLVENK